jgi:RimJ/RimL family protein N-acetyltransferase
MPGAAVAVTELSTPRLVLRAWRDGDRGPFADLNEDPEVMAHFPSLLPRDESDRLVDRFDAELRSRGWGIWAVERRDTGEFAGFVGLAPVTFEAWFAPAVEVGWRLARPHWGHGFATEGGRAALAHGLGALGLERVVSFTSLENLRSEAVMVRLGMTRLGQFDHPRVPEGHRLRRHVVYSATSAPRPA